MAAKKKKPTMTPRRPPSAALKSFVEGPVEAPSGQGVRGGLTTRRAVKTGEFKGQLEARVTVCIPEGLLMKAKVWCMENRTSLSAVVVEALRSRVGD